MTANPIDLVGGLVNTSNVVKADITAWTKSRVAQVFADVTEVRNTLLAGQLVIILKSTSVTYFLDTADTTTADDGVLCIISLDGKRFKILSSVPAPTAVTLGGVFSSAAVANQFVTGLNTSGTLLRAQPSLANLSDGITGKDVDGTFAANSDTVIPTQKAVKTYVDTVAQGLDAKPSVFVSTTANITLSGEQTLDGNPTNASRVLVKNQTAPAENGIYVSAAGAWTRALDANAWTELPGAYVFVEKGTTFGDCGFVCTVDAGGTIGSTAIAFTQFSGAGTYTASTGLTLTGTSFAIDATVATLTGAQALTNKTAYNKVAITAPATGATLTLADGGTLQTSGAFLLVLNTTGTTTAVFPTGTHTMVGQDTTDTLTNKTLDSAGTGNVLKVSGVTISRGQFPGESTTGSATAGNVGEIISATTVTGSSIALTTGTAANIATITLTAGEWDICAMPAFTGGATTTVTGLRSSISTTSATENTVAPNFFASSFPGSTMFATFDWAGALAPIRVSLSGSQQYWLVSRANFGVSTCNGYGTIRARRVR